MLKGSKAELKYTCPVCGKRYRYKGRLDSHIKLMHTKEPDTIVNDDNVDVREDVNEDMSNVENNDTTESSSFSIVDFIAGNENQLNDVYPISDSTATTSEDTFSPLPSSPTSDVSPITTEYSIGFDVQFFEVVNGSLNSVFKTDVFKMSSGQRRALREALEANGIKVSDPMTALITTIALMYIPAFVMLAVERGWFKGLSKKFDLQKLKNAFTKGDKHE